MPTDVKLNAEGAEVRGVKPNGPYHALAEALRNHHFRLYGTNPVTGPGSCIAEAADVLDEIEPPTDNSKPTPAVGDDVVTLSDLRQANLMREIIDALRQREAALAAAHSQHEADVARIGGLEQERDDLRKTNASLHRRTQYAERFRKSREVLRTELWGLIKRHIAREAAAVRRAEAAETRIGELTEALKPLGAAADQFDRLPVADAEQWSLWSAISNHPDYPSKAITVGDARRARSALAKVMP